MGYFKPMFMWIFVDSRFNSAHSTGTFKDQYGEGFWLNPSNGSLLMANNLKHQTPSKSKENY